MSAGGINAQQPLVGTPPSSVAAQSQTQQPVYAAPPATAASPAAASGTAFVPVAGQQAGSVPASGGLVGDGSIPRTVAIAAGVGGEALQQQQGIAAAQAQVAGQQVVDPATMQQGAATGAVASGPAAWNDEWAKAFKDAGAPAEVIQQLTITGAMGADASKLQQMLDQIKGEIDNELAKFAHEHPDAFKKLRGNKDVDRSMIAQIAAAVNAGQVPEEQLEQMVDSIGKSQGKMMFDMFVKPMIVWSLIPGWGALRLLPAPFTGGKDILTGEKMFGDPMSTTFTALAAVGGAMTIWNNAQGMRQVAQGHRMIGTAGSDAATIAAREGLDNITGFKKFWSYVPGTELNQQVAGISRLDDIKAGIGQMKAGSIQQELAQNLYNKVVDGDVLMWGDSASKWTKMGYQPNHRGFFMGHLMGKKSAATVMSEGARPKLLLDSRTTGKVTAAHFASLGTEFADDLANPIVRDGVTVGANLKTRMLEGGLDLANPATVKNLKDLHLGVASQQLMDAGVIKAPTGVNKILGAMRPGPIQDAVWAANNVAGGSLGKLHGWAGLPKIAKVGFWGSIAAAAGYFMWFKPQQDMKKEAEKQAAEQAAGGAGGIDPSQLSPEDLQVLQQFAAMPADQQAQIIQQQNAQLQQAMQTPNLTPEQQQQIAGAQAELQLLMQVAQGGIESLGATGAAPVAGQGAAEGAATGAGEVQPQGQQVAAPGAAQPQFTAQGLGLAG